jgi:hypothetical protein
MVSCKYNTFLYGTYKIIHVWTIWLQIWLDDWLKSIFVKIENPRWPWYYQKSSSAVVAILDIGNPHKNSNFVREHPMTISVQIWFNHVCSFLERPFIYIPTWFYVKTKVHDDGHLGWPINTKVNDSCLNHLTANLARRLAKIYFCEDRKSKVAATTEQSFNIWPYLWGIQI